MKQLQLAFFFFLLLCFSSPLLQAQTQTRSGAQVSKIRFLGKTTPLYQQQPLVPADNRAKKKNKKDNRPAAMRNFEGNDIFEEKFRDALPQNGDPVRQTVFDPSRSVDPVVPNILFDGINESESQIVPPDPNGDIGADHYVQTANSAGGAVFKIFNKDGDLLFGPSSLGVFWAEFNVTGLGDPVILYDQAAERWLLTELGQFGSDVMLVAISETSDPMGSWNAYEFQAPELPDYPKYGIWPNAYFITTNEVSSPDIPIYALDREAMLNGETNIEVQRLLIPKFNEGNNTVFQVASPADWDGVLSPPPVGAPGLVLRMYDDSWDGGQDKLELWELDLDWDDPTNTTVTGPIDMPTEPFESGVCDGSIFDCLDQSDGSTMSALMQVLMHRVNYRNFGTHEAIVLNHVVDVDGNDLAGVRWYELRKPSGGTWGIYQQGTIAPPDGNHRFMGSIALDARGNIALAYSVMGPEKDLSLRFTGRRVGDILGEMTVPEYEFAEGLSLNTTFRWGDYSAMTVDEFDGSTFWFTGEYMTDNNEWSTKVATFQLNRDTVDIGPSVIVSPTNSVDLTASETVEIKVKNFGLEAITGFSVGMTLDDNLVSNDLVAATIEPGEEYTHTFGSTVDLSQVGQDYSFKVFTTLNEDSNLFNDTLRQVITNLTRNDAQATSVTGIGAAICAEDAQIGIVVSNTGQENLNSVVIEWQLNGGMVQTINQSLDLAFGASDTIYIDLSNIQDGANIITVDLSLPNGVVDEAPSNNDITREFQAVTSGTTVVLSLLTDNYPAETSWELRDEGGAILYAGGSYPETQTVYEEVWCLGDGCYTFVLMDSYGDGITFGGVSGDYTITDGDGAVLATLMNASFGNSEENEFCYPFVCQLGAELIALNESSNGAGDGAIAIDPENGAMPFQYSIDGGANYGANGFFGNLDGGTYDVVILDNNGCTYESTVFLPTCGLVVDIDVMDASNNTMSDGQITFNLSAGYEPAEYSINGGFGLQEDPVFENLASGIYALVVIDSAGCVFNQQVFVGPCSVQSITNISNESAAGANDGSITIATNLGYSPFEYSIDGGITFQSSNTFSNLSGDTYLVVIRDAAGCITEETVTLTTCVLQSSIDATDATGPGLDDGVIVIDVTEGTEPFLYSINGGNSFQASNTFDQLAPDTYLVLIEDANGCSMMMEVTIGITVGITNFNINGSVEVFPNPTDGVFRVNIHGLSAYNTLPVEIIDATGRTIGRNRLVRYDNKLTVELSLYAYPAGVYFLRFNEKEFKQLVRVVRN